MTYILNRKLNYKTKLGPRRGDVLCQAHDRDSSGEGTYYGCVKNSGGEDRKKTRDVASEGPERGKVTKNSADTEELSIILMVREQGVRSAKVGRSPAQNGGKEAKGRFNTGRKGKR